MLVHSCWVRILGCVHLVLYPIHTALRERRDSSVTAKCAVVEASRRSRISIIAVVEPPCNRPVTFPVTEASPKHHRKIKHVQFFPRPLGDCLVTGRSWTRRIAFPEVVHQSPKSCGRSLLFCSRIGRRGIAHRSPTHP